MLMTAVSPRSEDTEVDDADVIERSQSAPSAFAVIFDRHGAEVYRFLARRVGEHLADDLTGQAMLLAFEQRSRYDSSYRSCLPWLYGIATNVLRHYRRAEARQYRALTKLGAAPVPEEHAESVVGQVNAAATARRLGPAIAQLSDSDRDILLLVAWEQLSYEEVARALDIPVGTVRSKLHRVRGKLRAALDGTNPLDQPGEHS